MTSSWRITKSSDSYIGKLFSSFTSRASHPLSEHKTISELLRDIPRNSPERALLEIGHWLAAIADLHDELTLEQAQKALLRLDDFARTNAYREMLGECIAPGTSKRIHGHTTVWQDLEHYNALVLKTCHDLACAWAAARPEDTDSSEEEKKVLLNLLGRGMAAWVERKKLLHFRYHPLEAEDWKIAHAMLRLAARTQLVRQPAGGAGLADTQLSVLQIYLLGCFMELAPLGNLPPEQIETLQGLLLRLGPSMSVTPKQVALSTHWINIAGTEGPRPVRLPTPQGSVVYYCSNRALYPQILKLAGELRDESKAPDWAKALPCSHDTLQSLVALLMHCWSDKPPERKAERISDSGTVLVVHGFSLSRRMVAHSRFALSGRTLNYEYSNEALNEIYGSSRFGKVDTVTPIAEIPKEEPLQQSPLETLQQMESHGDRTAIGHWRVTDTSEGGIGAIVPGKLRSKTQVGTLVAVRKTDDPVWRTAIIRRIANTATGQSQVGMAYLPYPSHCVLVKPCQAQNTATWKRCHSAWNQTIEGGGHGGLDGLLISAEEDLLLMPGGSFVENTEFSILSETGHFDIRMDEIIEGDKDFDLIRFLRLQELIA